MVDSPIPPPPTPEQAAAMAASAQRFYNEVWTLLAVGTLVTILRTVSRIRKVGFGKLQADDVLVLVALVAYGIESGLAYSVGAHSRGLANNGMTDAHREALPTDSQEYKLRVTGSIIQLCGWSSYSVLLWSLKTSWLVFYLRLTEGLGRHYKIRIYIGFFFIIGTWMVSVLNLFLGCRPFHRYWQINPNPGNICQPAVSNGIVWVFYALNISTDMYLLSIPLPMLWTSRLQRWKKFGLIFLFSGGVFVIVCATFRCVLIVTDPINGAQLAGSWAVRETFVAIVTTNLPHIFPLIKTWLDPLLGTIMSTRRSSQKHSNGTPKAFRTFGGGGGSSGPSWRGRGPPTANPITDFTVNGSEERIVDDIRLQELKNSVEESRVGVIEAKGNIHRSVEVEVVREDRAKASRSLKNSGSGDNNQPWARRDGEHSAYAEGPGVHEIPRRNS